MEIALACRVISEASSLSSDPLRLVMNRQWNRAPTSPRFSTEVCLSADCSEGHFVERSFERMRKTTKRCRAACGWEIVGEGLEDRGKTLYTFAPVLKGARRN